MQSLKWQNWALGVLLSVCTACAGPTDGTDFGSGEEQSAPADTAESSTLDDGVSEGGADGLEPGPDVPQEPADSESAEDVGGGEGGEADGSTEPLEDVEGSEGDGTDDTEEPGDEDVSSDAEESNDSAGDNDAEGEPVEADGDAEPVEPEGDGELEGEDGVEGDDDASADGENEGDERSDSVDEPEEQFSTTCEDRCGEPASESGGCGCDSECELLGTCCEDRCDQCTDLCETEPAGSCADACGGPGSDSACFCDSTCSNFGDCCTDACEECGVGCAPGEIPETPCTDGLTYAGCCAGDTLVWCENGVTVTVECALGCGVWKEGLSYYDCLSVGDSEPVPEQSGAFPLACDDIQGGPKACSEDSECNDGDVCNGVESCVDGFCGSGPELNCDDSNPCTEDLCSPQSGCSSTALTGTACGGEGGCAPSGTCDAGECIEGPGPCDDGNECTLDSCSESASGALECSYESIEGCVPEGPKWPEVETALQVDCAPCHFGGNQSTFTKSYTEANSVYMIYRIVEEQMPPSGLASPDLAGLIQDWVDSGAQDE